MEDIICLQCSNVIRAKDNWGFMDGEEHKITCSCGRRFQVIIERPIEYYIHTSQSDTRVLLRN